MCFPTKVAAVLVVVPAVLTQTPSVAGNFAAISKNKVAQNSCAVNCQIQYDVCTRLRGTGTPSPTVGTQQVGPPIVGLPHGPQCESDRDFCTMRCTLNPVRG
jgi:hypothetical protein